MNVGFAGHRRLDADAVSQISETLQRLFHDFVVAGQDISENDLSRMPSFTEDNDPTSLGFRLISGYAAGADQMAIEAWNTANTGVVHGVFPYLHESSSGFAWSNDPDLKEDGTEFLTRPANVNAATVLDGASSEQETPMRSAHLELARWVVRQSDVLVVVWNGETAGGAGGTAESVELALKKGIPVFWLDPSDAGSVVLIDEDSVWDDTSLFEIKDIAEKRRREPEIQTLPFAETSTVRECLKRRIVPTWLRVEPPHEPVEKRSIWRTVLRGVGVLPPRTDGRHHHEPTELESYQNFIVAVQNLDRHPSQPRNNIYRSFVQRLSRPFQLLGWLWIGRVKALNSEHEARLESPIKAYQESEPLVEFFQKVSDFSMVVSDRHRSQQILILRLAALAVFFGLLPVTIHWFVKVDDHKAAELLFKWVCVTIELLVLTYMFTVWWRSQKQQSHRLWSDARRLAERLRSVRATHPLGFDVNDEIAHAPRSWTEWLIKLNLRQAGPPATKMTRDELLSRAESARCLIVESQADYHRSNARKSHAIHERIELTENSLFVILFVCLVLFVVLVPLLVGFDGEESLDKRIKYGILFISAFFPAIGASCMALSAQLELTSISHHSDLVAPKFEGINKAILKELSQPDRASTNRIVELLREATKLALSDIDAWRNNLERRKIVRGP